MTKIVHDTFRIERIIAASPARVFAALTNAEKKLRWFAGPPSWKQHERTVDIRVGGREHLHGEHGSGMVSIFDAIYLDIVDGERVVYAYEMTVNGRKISTSLATFEVFPQPTGTKLVLTEQGAYYDDPDMAKYAPNGQNESRRQGTEGLMDKLAASCID
jgi:uncharacterized protein YndB with AHSA1/START domain